MKSKYIITAAIIAASALSISAQNSLPAPGSGGTFNPAPTPSNPGPGNPNWGPPPGPAWGSPWNSPVYVPAPTYVNSGTTNVVAVGYDAQGVWRTVPMTVQYQYDGVQYNVTVINAWNPWTDTWNYNVDDPAYNTTYYLRGNQYNYYTVLTTGTYYFNL
ncbi:MAG: hypothetical protein NC201_04730 [Prevotella sp.]|nr:hypothetical protein [Bacteroides sp.]MCM1366535.1 hypothetical protein [Prevotella sp.]